MAKVQSFTKTPFTKQAKVLSDLLRSNPVINEEELASLNETVGVLAWLNQLQMFWDGGGKGVPENLKAKLFEGREPQKLATSDQG